MITWYKSKHNKFNSISGSRCGFYLSKSLLENVEKSFDPVTVDVGLNENNEICIRFYPDLMGVYKVNWHPTSHCAKIGCQAFMKEIKHEHYTLYFYKIASDLDEANTLTIVLSEKDYVV